MLIAVERRRWVVTSTGIAMFESRIILVWGSGITWRY